jgi:hypothetical protein
MSHNTIHDTVDRTMTMLQQLAAVNATHEVLCSMPGLTRAQVLPHVHEALRETDDLDEMAMFRVADRAIESLEATRPLLARWRLYGFWALTVLSYGLVLFTLLILVASTITTLTQRIALLAVTAASFALTHAVGRSNEEATKIP